MFTKQEQAAINKAISIIKKRSIEGPILTNSDTAEKFAQLQLGAAKSEQFLVLFLTNQHQLIASEILFNGTIDGASVHVREIAMRALELNAAAVIFGHNHPSGIVDPSSADRAITYKLKEALDLFSIRVLDHVIVSTTGTTSFTKKGFL